ncbi:MAG: hypothetical protein ACT4QF_25165 [Sporichthyaceae bacterium]
MREAHPCGRAKDSSRRDTVREFQRQVLKEFGLVPKGAYDS